MSIADTFYLILQDKYLTNKKSVSDRFTSVSESNLQNHLGTIRKWTAVYMDEKSKLWRCLTTKLRIVLEELADFVFHQKLYIICTKYNPRVIHTDKTKIFKKILSLCRYNISLSDFKRIEASGLNQAWVFYLIRLLSLIMNSFTSVSNYFVDTILLLHVTKSSTSVMMTNIPSDANLQFLTEITQLANLQTANWFEEVKIQIAIDACQTESMKKKFLL